MSTERSFRDLMAFWTSGTEWNAEQELLSLLFLALSASFFSSLSVDWFFVLFFFAFVKHYLPIIALYCSFSHTPRISTDVFKSQFSFQVRENLIAHYGIGIPCPDLIRCDYSKLDWQAPIPVCMYLERGEEGTF